MNIGEKVTVDGMEWHSGPLTGHVCWVHPQGRFYVVEFKSGLGVSVREAFQRANAGAPVEELAKYKHGPLFDREGYGRQLMHLYKKGLTDNQIGAVVGRNRRTINGWRNRNHLPPNKLGRKS